MKKYMKLLASFLLVFSFFLGAGAQVGAETATATIELTDMLDHQVELEAPATSIIAVAPSDAEILYALGAGPTLVARGSYVDFPEESAEVEDIGSGDTLNVEKLIELDPDLVILASMGDMDDLIKQLEDAGIAVYVSNANTIEEVYVNISNIAQLIGKDGEGEKLIAEMATTFKEYEEKAKDAEPKSVYFEISPLEFGLWTAGNQTFMDEFANILNLDNVFKDVEGWAEISEEQVIEKDPAYIITTSFSAPDQPTPEEEIMGREGWEDIQAVKDKHVYQVDSNEFTRPGPRLMDAVKKLYDYVYEAE